ncbi:MAG: putative Sensory box sensor histidine kinase/response regulator [Chitinophagaceae bacterium]|nr:MAG: putative Sensory box sensor histidine kinase/response regulator [Chitinophagaceae bacterium]
MIKTPFRNLSIKNKLFLSHFLILLITVIIILITIRVNDKRGAIELMLDRVDDIRIKAQQQNEAKQEFLLSERFNEEFFKTGNSQSIGMYAALLKQIDDDIAIINKHELSKTPTIAEQIIQITHQIHQQDELFSRMIDSVRQMGYGKMGLMGSFKNYTDELEQSKLINQTLLDLLKKNEQAYLLYKEELAVKRFDSLIDLAIKTYSNSPSSVLMLSGYKRNFDRMVELERSVGSNQRNGLKTELAEQSKNTDKQLKLTIDSIRNTYRDNLKNLEWIFLGLIGVAFIIGILVSYVLSVEITRPIISLNNAIREVVATKFKDDINPKIIDPDRKDEIGQLTANFNLAIRKIRRSIRIIQDKSTALEAKNIQLIHNEENLKTVNSQKDKFLSIISHDMRAPLSSIISFLDYYKDNFNSFTETEIDFVSTNLNTHVKKVVEMLDGLLLWSRSQTGEIQTILEPVDLAKIIMATVEVMNQSALNKKIEITTSLHNQLVWADKNMTAFAIRNILSNAIKFTREGGSIQVYTMRNRRHAYVIVKDKGVGIAPENLAKLFQENVSHSTFGTNEEKGIGLGLVLCRDFMDMQNGSIEVESIQGEGTTVNLLFPLVGIED